MLKNLSKYSLAGVGVQVLVAIIGFIQVFLLTKFLGDDGFGLYVNAFSYLLIISSIASLGGGTLLLRESSKALKLNKYCNVYSVFTYCLKISTIIILLLLLLIALLLYFSTEAKVEIDKFDKYLLIIACVPLMVFLNFNQNGQITDNFSKKFNQNFRKELSCKN